MTATLWSNMNRTIKTATELGIKLPTGGYYGGIIMACKCTPGEAVLIESVMRDLSPTLDHLTASQYRHLAKKAQGALVASAELRTLIIEGLGYDPTK